MRNEGIGSLQPLLLAAGVVLVGQTQLQAEERGFYFNGAVGASLAEKVDVKEFLGPGGGAKVKFDPGVHLGLAGGYNFNDWLGAELETGVLANSIDRLGNSSPDASVSHVPFLANVILRYETDDFPVTPYFGAGLGGDSSVFIIDDSLGVDGSDADLVFAYQFMVGVRYKINERMSAGLGYKYFHSDSASWDVERTAGEIRFGDATVHAISGVFNWKF